MDRILVSVIILNWNGGETTHHCLEHVFAQTYAPLEVIVVDNGSQDGSCQEIGSHWGSRIKMIRNAQNLGFAGGMNQGIAASSGAYLLLLNSDVFLKKDYIEKIIARFAQDQGQIIGVIGGKLFRYIDGTKTTEIDHVGFFLRARMAVANSSNGNAEELVFGPSGASPMIRRSALDATALSAQEWFDSSYFAYNEDIDLWFRCQLYGWKVLFYPEAVGWHIHSGSVGGKQRLYERADFLQVHALKNRYMTIIKNYPGGLFVCMLPVFIAVEIGVPIYFLYRSPRTLVNLQKAWKYVWQNRHGILNKRRQIQSRRQVSVAYLLTLFRGL
jgi:GT2 family glycosyltransferase